MNSESSQLSPLSGAFPGCCLTDQTVTILLGWHFWGSSKTILSLLVTARVLGFTTTMVLQLLVFKDTLKIGRERGWEWGKLKHNKAHFSY